MADLATPKIDIEVPVSDFSEHLVENKRILFSGKFGIGKTFFLKHFFGTEKMKEKYNIFHLTPVNYQIANNEDIFELIKYDILYHLFGLDWIKNINKEEFSKLLVAQSYLLNNGVSIVSKIVKCIPIIDKAGKAIETLSNIHKDFLEYSRKINENEITLLDNFFNHFKKKQGSVHEFDAISEFIYDNLTNCNNDIENKEKHKENVLIIDDLDRIDPEHIFRILNVFSAHIDIEEDTNKFGFDKIIFVCDVENIRNIFAAKYGQNTDFGGYIDKFYTSTIFCFNNKVAISEFVKEIMRDNYYNTRNEQNGFLEIEMHCLRDILELFVEKETLNLRKIFANVEALKGEKHAGIIGYNYFAGYTIGHF